jgi:hypothetical protein
MDFAAMCARYVRTQLGGDRRAALQFIEDALRERLARQTEVILSKDSLSRELAINRIRDALRKADVGGSPVAEAASS